MKLSSVMMAAATMAAAMLAQPASATSYEFMATYFKVSADGIYTPASAGSWWMPATPASTTGDFYGQVSSGWSTAPQNLPIEHSYNMVESQLGPNGMPVLSSGYTGALPIKETNAAGELQWWTPNGSHVVSDGTATITTDANGRYDNTKFFETGGTGSDAYFRTAILSGTVTLDKVTDINFAFGGDDDVFLFVDGLLVKQDAGIHEYGEMVVWTGDLGIGDHTFEMFYADRNPTNAEIHFQIITKDLDVAPTPPSDGTLPTPAGPEGISAVPEPATWAMMIGGFGLVGASMRRRKVMLPA